MAERFGDEGVDCEPLVFDVFTDQLLLPRPPSGRGRLTITLRDIARSFEVEVPLEAALPLRFDESEIIDSASKAGWSAARLETGAPRINASAS